MNQPAILQFRPNEEIRPRTWANFVGQPHAVRILQVAARGALARGESLPHVLLSGPPGLGKTTLAGIIASEMGVAYKTAQGPELDSPASLAAVAMELKDGDILFLDEVHRAKPQALEVLYEVMEPAESKSLFAQAMPKVSIVAATTNPGKLPQPFNDRFRLKIELHFYSVQDIVKILTTSGTRIGLTVDELAAEILAVAAHGTPRVAINYLLFARDLVESRMVGMDAATEALGLLGIDPNGYTELQRLYLHHLAYRHNGGPASLDTLAAGISKDRDSVMREVEPILLRNNFLVIQGRGRKLTGQGVRYVRENIGL